MKRITSFLLAIAMFIQIGCCVSAMGSPEDLNEYKSEFDILFETEILTVDKYGNYAPKVNLKRNEMCYTLARMAGVGTSPEFEQIFSDVDETIQYASEINALKMHNIISGNGDGTFNPDGYVLTQDVLVPVIKMLGLDDIATLTGGYPKGYINVARENKLLKGLESGTGDFITKIDFARLVKNAVECPLYKIASLNQGGGIEKEKSDETLLSKNYNILKITGLVYANQYAGISASAVGEGQVIVGSEILHTGETDVSGYLGYSVDAYYDKDNNTIISYNLNKRCSSFQITDAQEPKFSGNTLSYIRDNGSVKNEKIRPSTVILYNMKPIQDIQNITGNISDAVITCVDNDGDNQVDVMVVNKYQHKVVRYLDITSRLLFIENETEPRDLDSLECSFYDFDGNIIDESYVKKGNAVSIIESEDGKNVQFYIGDNTITGIVEGVSEDRVVIEGVEYRWCQGFDVAKFRVGDTMNFLLSIDGKILDEKKAVAAGNQLQIGYIVDYVYLEDEERLRIKMAEYGEEDPVKYYISEKMWIDGAKLKPEKIRDRLDNNTNNGILPIVTYETDSLDNLVMLNTMYRGGNEDPDKEIYESHIADGQTYTWRSSAKIFNIDKKANNQIVMSNNTIAIYVGLDAESKIDCTITGLSLGNDATKSNFNTYKIGEDSIEDSIILFNESAKSTMYFDRYMSLSIIEKIKTRCNEKTGEIQTYVTVRTNGSRREAFVMEGKENNFKFYIDSNNSVLRNKYGLNAEDEYASLAVQVGDIVKLSYSEDGEINGGQIMFRNDIGSIEMQKLISNADGSTSNELYNNEDYHAVSRCIYGYVYDIQGNVVLISRYSPEYIREHNLTKEQMYKICEKHRLPAEMYTWNEAEREKYQFAIADTQEIYSVLKNGSRASKVFLYSVYSGDRMMVIYKDQ